MKTIRIILCIAAIVAAGVAHAQGLVEIDQMLMGEGSSLPEQMIEQLRLRAAEKVGVMNQNITFMGDKNNPIDTRRYYRKQALNLFVGFGYEYTKDGQYCDGVTMETTSKYRRNKTRKLIRDYFEALIGLRYSQVKIESTDVAAMKVSNLKKVADDEYVCTCTFDQAFCGYRDGRPVYKDITTKRVICHIKLEQTIDGLEAVVMLGDVEALETK
ncbi:MAG: hypothetical protein IJ724_10015 [Muribaculaceae bacterium]|nr:hypothetical protein [Muribaculaceae bacterium]MBR1726962.1 hypothetical protein [Muribaculaceae bacterium]